MHLTLITLSFTFTLLNCEPSPTPNDNNVLQLFFKSSENALQIKFKLKYLNYLDADLVSIGNSTACKFYIHGESLSITF